MNAFNIDFSWHTIFTDGATSYLYPNSLTAFMRTEYSRPGVYRWVVCLPDGRLERQYVGETEKLHRRLGAYLKPHGRTERQVRQELDGAREQGLGVRFEVLEFAPFEINGFEFHPRLLTNPFARKAVENLVLLSCAETGCHIINRGRDMVEKILSPLQQFDRLPPTAVLRELKRLSSGKSACK